MHDDIRKFNLEGEFGETNIVKVKDNLVRYVESMMRDYSYIPALDLEPQFTLNYSVEDEIYKFNLSVYGVKVRPEKAWSTAGIMGGKEIPAYQHS